MVTTDHQTLHTSRKPLGEQMGAFKTVSTKQVNHLRDMPGAKLWQRGFWDHIVRDGRRLASHWRLHPRQPAP